MNYRSHQKETGKRRTRRSRRPRPSSPASPTPRWATCSRRRCRRRPPSSTTRAKWPWSSARKRSTSPKRTRSATSPATRAYNDFTVRDWQLADHPVDPRARTSPAPAASAPTWSRPPTWATSTSSPWKPASTATSARRPPWPTSYFTIPQLIAYVTGFTRLSPGDVIVTGTPGGVGLFMDPSGLLSEGDVVEVEITGLGTLRNTRPAASPEWTNDP